MARRSLPRLVLAALAVAAIASCSDDEPEAVATGGGLELSSTTTEQPRITEPPETTTTSTTSTTTEPATTTTSTTTTTTQPAGPTVEELSGALPAAAALPAGPWDRGTAGTELAGAPGPLCEGSTVATPLSGVVDQVSIADGVSARYDRADGRSSIQLVVAPLPDVVARVAEARTEVASCPGVWVLDWPMLGDGSLAYTRAATNDTDGTTWVLAHTGTVVVGLNLHVSPADGVEAQPPPTDAELQAFVQTAVTALATG